MARIDYYALEEAIRNVLLADEALRDQVQVMIEGTVVPDRGPVVVVTLDRRDAPRDLQTLSAGQRTKMRIRFPLWCYAYALEIEALMRARDDLVGKVEVAMMKAWHLNLEGTVEMGWIEGGEFETPSKSGEGWELGAEVVFVADVTARTI